MNIDGWKYYNHAALPDCAPHETPDDTPVKNNEIWKIANGKAILARWTTDYDCGYDTGWYYVVLDKPFNIDSLKANRRYEINKGNRNFEFRKIDCNIDCMDLYNVYTEAVKSYETVTPDSYETFSTYIKSCSKRNDELFGAYHRESDKLCGYVLTNEKNGCISLVTQKAIPEYEKYGLNACLICGVCEYYHNDILKGKYICDGEKAILHQTAFQLYLEKYFQFRKVFCKLNLRFRKPFGFAVTILYPFRKIIYKMNFLKKVSGILKMQEIVTSNNNKR